MKIVIAGATGAIGQPFLKEISSSKNEVFGLTQSEERTNLITSHGAQAFVIDVLNKEDVRSAFSKIKPDIVIDMLTRLPKEYTPEAMKENGPLDAKLRWEGGANLLQAAIENGAKRYIAQSSGFWYEPGNGLANESTSFALNASPGVAAGSKLYQDLEDRLFKASIDAVALRFGFFYGPGTWFNPDGNVADQIRKQNFPIIGNGLGIWNFVHIEEAAKAIILSLNSESGTYNIVNDQPSPMKEWLPAFAKYIGAPSPKMLSEDEGLKTRGADSVYYATKLRAASNSKAKRILKFQPRPFDWITENK